MTKGRDYLRLAYDLFTKLEQLRKQQAELTEMIMHITAVFRSDYFNRGSSVADKSAQLVACRMDVEQHISECAQQYFTAVMGCEELLRKMPHAGSYELLCEHYIMRKSLSIIGKTRGITYRQILRAHAKALDEFDAVFAAEAAKTGDEDKDEQKCEHNASESKKIVKN